MGSVFVSHRGADSAIAERLAVELRDRGHSVWLDTWAIGVGDSVVAAINEGLEGSRYLVLCCSAAGTSSPWMSREWMSALARQLSGADVKLLPVKLAGGDRPAILADIKYADLSADWAVGIDALCRAIR